MQRPRQTRRARRLELLSVSPPTRQGLLSLVKRSPTKTRPTKGRDFVAPSKRPI